MPRKNVFWIGIIIAAAIIGLLICGTGVAGVSGDTCHSDRAVMAKGIQAVHEALTQKERDVSQAIKIIEYVADATGVPL